MIINTPAVYRLIPSHTTSSPFFSPVFLFLFPNFTPSLTPTTFLFPYSDSFASFLLSPSHLQPPSSLNFYSFILTAPSFLPSRLPSPFPILSSSFFIAKLHFYIPTAYLASPVPPTPPFPRFYFLLVFLSIFLHDFPPFPVSSSSTFVAKHSFTFNACLAPPVSAPAFLPPPPTAHHGVAYLR